ncbi:translation elongation factor Ts [Myxococcota bacterium]|nr:translation elongation factor Ts [Myxococcota bacterium]MBU1896703.1 translation elongation factor Ts [Myxococcota bacterium]
MAITATAVKDLREATGAGMMDCKRALVETDGDMAKAIELLQKKNLAAVGKRAGRIAAEGTVGSYIHDGRIGVLLEVNCETDFVGRGDAFQEMVRNICMHIAAVNPQWVDDSEIPEAVLAKQREIFTAQMENSGKPANIIDRIVDGKIAKWKTTVCLLDQPYVRDSDKSIKDYITEIAAVIKENIKVRRFARFELGEGLEKRQDDFAAEVAAQVG